MENGHDTQRTINDDPLSLENFIHKDFINKDAFEKIDQIDPK